MSAIETQTKAPAVKEQRVRELAYQIWETEGCPDGQHDRHWELANKLAEVEISAEPAPAQRARTKPREAAQVTAAEITLPPATRKSRTPKTGAAKTNAPGAAGKIRDTTTNDT